MAKNTQIRNSGLTIDQLIRNTPQYVRHASGYVAPRSTSFKYSRREEQFTASTRTTIPGEKPRIHVQQFALLHGNGFRNGQIRFNCDCEFFTFVCEVALWRHGAAKIVTSNGEFPYQTNPKGIPMLCKHGFILLSRVSRNPPRM